MHTRNLFSPTSDKPFKLSRSKLERFLECPLCFHLDRRLGIDRPSGPGFSLNIAVDHLLKKEFDIHRANGEPHPLMKQYGIDAVPLRHDDLEKWRHNFTGIQWLHKKTNLLVFGAVDDVWVDPKGTLMVVDYKATSKEGEIDMNDKWKQAYKRQMEIYQWLLRQNGHTVSDTGYFVYVNAGKDRHAFDGRLEFKVELFPYAGSDEWVEDAIVQAHKCLFAKKVPKASVDCEWCAYRQASYPFSHAHEDAAHRRG